MGLIKRLLLSESGKVSLTKIGTTILTIAATIITLKESGIYIPEYIFNACVIIAAVGGKITIDGIRDVIAKHTGKK